MKKIYVMGERSSMADLRLLCKKLGTIDGIQVLDETLSSLNPEILKSNANIADAFLIHFSRARPPSRFLNFELDMVARAICSVPGAYRPLFIMGDAGNLLYNAEWIQYIESDDFTEIKNFIVSNPVPTLSGVVIEEDDGYHD